MNRNHKYIFNNKINQGKHLSYIDKQRLSSKYNNTVMKDETLAVATGFADKLARLRTTKQISAREMSLSLGQGASYINDIENKRYLPSMGMFFEICEYLEVSPVEFFDYTLASESGIMTELSILLKGLDKEDKEYILYLAKRLSK